MSKAVPKQAKKLDFPINTGLDFTENIFKGFLQFFAQFQVYPSICNLPISGKFGEEANKIRKIFDELRLETSFEHILRGEGIIIIFYPGDATVGYKLNIVPNNTVPSKIFRFEL